MPRVDFTAVGHADSSRSRAAPPGRPHPIRPNEAITASRLVAVDAHVREGHIVVMRSCREQQRSPRTPEFWTEVPYMIGEASEWLLERRPRAVAFGFSQPFRGALGSPRRRAEARQALFPEASWLVSTSKGTNSGLTQSSQRRIDCIPMTG